MAPLAGLNYKRCRVEELKVFVEKRTGKTPPKSSKKQRLLDTLDGLDEDPAVFRLLDLPPEMRNLIYGHLLRLQPGTNGRLCSSPTICRCSKQSRDEALGILYGNNTPQIAIRVAHRANRAPIQGPQIREYSVLGVTTTHVGYEGGPWTRLGGTHSAWPAHLLRFHGVEVNFVVDAQHSTTTAEAPQDLRIAVNHCLYSICAFLASSRVLKTVKVSLTVNDGELPEGGELRKTLWPITRLGRTLQLKLEGISDEAEQSILDHMLETPAAVDILGKSSRLIKKVQHLKTLMDDVKQRGYRDRVIARGFEMQELLNSRSYVDEHDDEELKKQIRKLEELFADAVVVQIKAKADAYLARVQETRDGAFKEA
ncbi:hypothetical protein DOTSEDRAFT_36249 [Dothistroma septosporum NZE10]|uniref:Uncharacterized protein n=1 Tax=Dothistroma septosporum (strain NZE10 / CBS 128990) TaxID=675120 RepID=N1PIZ3_DOTSN|nr:hypothetical protein DOTSEDRAFT_36249 [Dothistroma septosporum NZE10]